MSSPSAPADYAMSPSLVRKVELVSAWCGIVYLTLLFGGWFLAAGFYPMHKPSAGAAEIAHIFQVNSFRIRIGMVIVMVAATTFIPFGAAMAERVARFEAPRRTMTYTFVMSAFSNAMFTFYPPLWWIIASYRANVRSADLTYLLNDIGWLQFLGGLDLILPMFLIIPVVALTDRRPVPIFPRWVGYLNLFVFVIVLPGQLMFFFYSGPFAWNGLVGIWIPLAGFAAWFLAMFYCLRQSALRGV